MLHSKVSEVKHESRNCHNRYAIAVMKHLPGTLVASVAGHLPREISRCTYFIVIHGAKVSCKVMGVHHRQSPLAQGGLEIPFSATRGSSCGLTGNTFLEVGECLCSSMAFVLSLDVQAVKLCNS